MVSALIFTRLLLFAAQISLAGIFVFTVVVAVPAYAQIGPPMPEDLRRKLMIGAAVSLATIAVAAIPRLLFVAAEMSGQPVARLFSRGVITTVLTRTQFGHASDLRILLCLLVAPCVTAIGKRGTAAWIGAALSLILAATTAWEGHAGADTSWEAVLHLAADAAHLVAAGSWVGALLPLALLLATARREGDRANAILARRATIRFSTLGMVCVATLLVTGTINAWFLVGSIPALIGTLYGQLLLAKIALFFVIVAIAAINLLRLSPRLATTDHGRKAMESRAATALLARNAAIEASIGLVVIAIVAALGILTPAAHQEPWWPFPYRLGFDAIEAVPDLRKDAIGTAALALLGLVLIAFGWRRRRRLLIATGLLLFVGLGWRPIELVMIPATPASYYVSAEPYTVKSIIAGGNLYAQNCVACHGGAGLGDGPLAAELPIAPSDLTTHLSVHRDGDLYWFISAGMDGGVMPPFAASLDDTQRWEIIAALRAHAATVELEPLSADVTTEPAPIAPDFSFATEDGAPSTLKALLARDAVLLLFAGAPESAFAARLDGWRSVLAKSGVTILTITDDPDARSVYAFYDQGHPRRGAEPFPMVAFLIDRDGYIRASWHPGDLPDWRNLETLEREIAAAEHLRLAPAVASGHVHSPS